jgi:hypothetical protein
MATDKRDRQRANKDIKRAEQAKKTQKTHRISVIKKYTWYTVLFAMAIIALKVFFG